MKCYIVFILKRCWKRKINLALVGLMVLIISGIFFMNLTNQDRLKESLETAKNEYRIQEKEYSLMLDTENDDTDFALDAYNASIDRIRVYEELCKEFNAENKQDFYKGYINILNENKQAALENDEHSKEMIEDLSKQLAYFTYLNRHDLDYEDMNYPIFALPFLISLFDNILLLIVLVFSICICTQIYSFNYHQSMDLGKLLPYSHKRILLIHVFMSFFISLGILLGTILFSLLLSLTFTQNMGIDYPVLMTTVSNGITDVFLKDLLLSFEILAFANLLCFVLFQWIHDEMTILLLFMGASVLFGYLPGYLGIVKPFVHFIPFSYIQTGNIINGTLASLVENNQLTLDMGALIFGIYIVFLIVCLYFYSNYSRKNT